MDNPYPRLCPNTPAPRPDPFDLAFPTSYSLFGAGGKHIKRKSIQFKNRAKLFQTADRFAMAEFEEWMQNQTLSDTSVDLHQSYPYRSESPIDTKSFSQQFFSSPAWSRQPLSKENHDSSRDPSKLLNTEHSRYNADSTDSIIDSVFAELENINESTRSKSLLFGGEAGVRFLANFYPEQRPSDTVEETGRQRPPAKGKKAISIMIDRAKLFRTLPDPSRLMLYGLSPDPVTSFPPSSFGTTSSGFQFFRSRISQSSYTLHLELSTLLLCGIDPCSIQEGLVSSIKSTNFDPTLRRNMPTSIASHIMAISIAAVLMTTGLCAEDMDESVWDWFESFRRQGKVLFDGRFIPEIYKTTPDTLTEIRGILDTWALAFEEPGAQYLMKLILRSFASWSYSTTRIEVEGEKHQYLVEDQHSDVKNRLMIFLVNQTSVQNPITSLNWRLLEWARTIFLRNWDGEAGFHWNTDVGASIEFMRWMYTFRDDFGIESKRFEIEALMDRLDYLQACKGWMGSKSTNSTGNLLDFPWLFSKSAKVTMFRAINLCRMFSAYEKSAITTDLHARMVTHTSPTARQVLDRLSISMDMFLLLDIRRDNILRDAFNQLWRRQKRELFRPLKVRMGMDEGEEGVDMGGVQQEFFRLAIADATDPAKGLFSIDEKTRMTWFQPISLAPLHQFTLLGLLFGLALYNGITLSITFPLVFYRKLLGVENENVEDIKDGWPDLYNGLVGLLYWPDDQVEATFLRTYTFSFESLGNVHNVDMNAIGRGDEWSIENPGNTQEPIMVSNDNREKYVNDYIFWLTDKSIGPQFKAFANGFYLPLQKKALHLLSPEDLQSLLEGHQMIDLEELKKTTRYEDGYSESHPKIIEFWEIVEKSSPEQHVKLLEFVTASTRVPVRGVAELTFIIQRNGVGDDRLPSSMTCFGRLLLPEYSSKQIMTEKLMLAIENNTGFGTQ